MVEPASPAAGVDIRRDYALKIVLDAGSAPGPHHPPEIRQRQAKFPHSQQRDLRVTA